MTEGGVRQAVGLFVVASHFLLIVTAIGLFIAGGFLYDELTTILAVIVPMFGVYTTAIIKKIVADRNVTVDTSKKVTGAFVFLSWFIPILFVGFLFFSIILKSINVGFASFDEFKGLLVAGETLFGAYVGLIIGSLYELKPVSLPNKRGPGSSAQSGAT